MDLFFSTENGTSPNGTGSFLDRVKEAGDYLSKLLNIYIYIWIAFLNIYFRIIKMINKSKTIFEINYYLLCK